MKITVCRAFLMLAVLLTGCTDLGGKNTAPATPPKEKPALTVEPKVMASAESQRIAAYYKAIEARLISQGKLRQEYAPPDATFTAKDLVRNFETVALFDEYKNTDQGFVEEQTSSYLRRWQQPVRIGLFFGASVDEEQRKSDTSAVKSFARRLSSLAGLRIEMSPLKNANYIIMFMNRDEQRNETSKLAETIPNLLAGSIVSEIQNSPRNIYCVAYALSNEDKLAEYSGAVILIKAEHSPVLRNSCIQEEMTQALGLGNDSPDIRPSIFNDDEEFARLTRHDEMLLKMLYDKRLKVGMTPDVARPILLQVAEDVLKPTRI